MFLDASEDFSHIQDELSGGRHKEFRRSRLREFISNPRHSTFRQLTPTATAFHATARASLGPSSGLPGMRQFADVKRGANALHTSEKPSQRVTVHFANGTPMLHLRFSALEIPTPEAFKAKSLSPRPTSEWVPVSRPVSLRPVYLADSRHNSFVDSRNYIASLESPPQAYVPPKTKATRIQSSFSMRSIPESYTSLAAFRELAPQFPPLPANALEPVKQSPSDSDEKSGECWDDATSADSQVSIYIAKPETPAPRSSGSDINPFMSEVAPQPVTPISIPSPLVESTRTRAFRDVNAHFRVPSVPTSALSTPMTFPSGCTPTPPLQLTGDTDDGFLDFGSALNTSKSRAFTRDSSGAIHPAAWIDYDAIPPVRKHQSQSLRGLPVVMEESDTGQPGITRAVSRHSRKSGSMGTLTLPWLKNPEVQEERRLAREVSRGQMQGPGPRLSRMTSIGRAPMRPTPVPVKTGHVVRGSLQGSLYIGHIIIPPKENTNVEIIQGSVDTMDGRGVLRDSEVLEIEDGTFAKAVRTRGYVQ
ncbi:hypothetical protein DXG03_006941 [Asterophora parasitica]|uniref:Uncharacterized protein n=1 Tax=Asterophora parasitica TaxID=117018 RepID=A0A9P7K9C8_9AGAR|nr:hypothetical protein DXG03_006941 [Asterophora parasitica]